VKYRTNVIGSIGHQLVTAHAKPPNKIDNTIAKIRYTEYLTGYSITVYSIYGPMCEIKINYN